MKKRKGEGNFLKCEQNMIRQYEQWNQTTLHNVERIY